MTIYVSFFKLCIIYAVRFLNIVLHLCLFFGILSFCVIHNFVSAAIKASKLKRKRVVDSAPSSDSKKVMKVANGAAKQVASKQSAVRNTKSRKSKTISLCPGSEGCARASINGWEWRRWSVNASPSERARIRGSKYVYMEHLGSDVITSQWSNGKGLSARTNRAKLRNLVAAAEGADLLKATQLKVTEG